ncbi:hypothetical protein [Actinomadura pelletieri]|uniref:hypothetical protein n=1 Tax=Actinomadura pelletieri TaxID=111805 RepID=UPI0011C42BF0|nr:hypothetical protein [Actinomadura pelletieri]
MYQTLKDIGCVLSIILFSVTALAIIVFFYAMFPVGREEDAFPDTNVTIINETRSPVRIAHYDATTGFRTTAMPLEIAPGAERPVDGGDDCKRRYRIPREGNYLFAQTADGRAATLGPPQPCGGVRWRITRESLREGVNPQPDPPLWSR